MKKRTVEPWRSAPDDAHDLSGFGVDLLVRDVAVAIAFQCDVLAALVVHADADFAVLGHGGSEWMLHADHSCADHPLLALTGDGALRGVGIELRLHQCDPDGHVWGPSRRTRPRARPGPARHRTLTPVVALRDKVGMWASQPMGG